MFKPLDEEATSRIAALKIIKASEEYGLQIKSIAPEIVHDILLFGDGEVDARELVRPVHLLSENCSCVPRRWGTPRLQLQQTNTETQS